VRSRPASGGGGRQFPRYLTTRKSRCVRRAPGSFVQRSYLHVAAVTLRRPSGNFIRKRTHTRTRTSAHTYAGCIMKYAFPIFRYYRGTIYLLTNAARRVMRIMQKGKRERKKPRYKAGRAGFLRRVRRFSVRRMRRELWRLGEPPASPDRDCTTPRRALSLTALTAGLPELFSLSMEEERVRGGEGAFAGTCDTTRDNNESPISIRLPLSASEMPENERGFHDHGPLGPAEAPLPSPPLPLVPLGARISRERFHFGSKPLLGDTARAPARSLQRYSSGGGTGRDIWDTE